MAGKRSYLGGAGLALAGLGIGLPVLWLGVWLAMASNTPPRQGGGGEDWAPIVIAAFVLFVAVVLAGAGGVLALLFGGASLARGERRRWPAAAALGVGLPLALGAGWVLWQLGVF